MNELPVVVQEIIAEGLTKVKLADLEKAFASLSSAYREGKKAKHLIGNDQERLLYLAARLPATYSALCQAIGYFQRIAKTVPGCSLLDIGAGPGTFLLAASQMGLKFDRATLVEKDPSWRNWGEKLLKSVYTNLSLSWLSEEIEKVQNLDPHDFVVMSYSLGELDPQQRQKALEKCWAWTKQSLFLVEPGTPAGFDRIREARTLLLGQGASIVAPCPHANVCPMAGSDWCHFSARLPRTSLHRRVKGGELGYEDEKFSYVIFSREPHALPSARILRHPQKNKGHVRLHLCQQDRLEQGVYSKKQGELYKHVRSLEWGDYI